MRWQGRAPGEKRRRFRPSCLRIHRPRLRRRRHRALRERFHGEGVSLVLYGGKFTDTSFLSILFRQQTDYRESYIYTGGLSFPLEPTIRDITFETEGNLTKHDGIMQHLEMNGFLIARFRPFSLPFSVALGEGLSVSSRNPGLETWRKDILKLRLDEQRTSPLLNYLVLEMAFGLPFTESSVFFRIHHRSGVFGTYCPPTCGSNFISYGVRLPVEADIRFFAQ